MKSFDIDEYNYRECEVHNHGFYLGEQSKQSEVDGLRKRIDEINDHVEVNYDENRDDDSHSYWSGYNQALRELFNILKGD